MHSKILLGFLLLNWATCIKRVNTPSNNTIDNSTKSVTTKQSEDQNTCICNTNSHYCDEYCCCDDKCSKEEIDSWKKSGICAQNQITDTTDTYMCRSLDQKIALYS